MIDVVVFALGALVVIATLMSAVRTVVVPRGEQVVLERVLFTVMAGVFTVAASTTRSPVKRDSIWARYAPITMLMMPLMWAIFVVGGFAVMFWTVGVRTFRDAFVLSGSSFTTLGIRSAEGTFELVLVIAEAVLGLGLIALLLSFMPALYSAFSRREALVARLEVRAGRPPTVVGMITRANSIGWLDDLGETWSHWEQWFIEVEESHTTYSALNFFRSSMVGRSWLTSSGVVLDTAAFMLSSVRSPWSPEAALMLRSGYLTLNRVATFVGIPVDQTPAPTDPVSISRADYDSMCDELSTLGVQIVDDRDQGWRDFSGWRVNYDQSLLGLLALQQRPTLLLRPKRALVGLQ